MSVPAQIGRYRIEGALGGNMCQVVRAVDTRLGRQVALKILSPDAGAERRERLLAEARMSSSLRHQNLVQVFDFGEEDGRMYLVMELLDGCNLRQAMASGGPSTLARKLEIARETGAALEYIHVHKIIHRDVKPENIFLDADGRVKLMDFGVAKFEGLQLTGAGFTLGTPYYMAPEQVRGENLTHLVDVYAFGITFFELLAGVRPTNGTTVERVFDEILHQPVDISPLRAAKIPEHLVHLIGRCTAKIPDLRPQRFAEILPELTA